MDGIWAIRSNSGGVPVNNGPIGHVVRVSSLAAMTTIDEFTDGGRFPNADCAPASMLSSLRDRGIAATIGELEQLAGTTSRGTGIAGIATALRHYGVDVTLVIGEPPSGYVMNPAGGFVASPSLFGSYLNASQHAFVRIDTPGPWDLPAPAPPSPPPAEDPDMIAFTVKPGDPDLLVPGLTGNSNINLVALKDCQVALFMWDPLGKPIAAKTVNLEGNLEKPGVGPVQLYGYLRQLLGTTFAGPCTLSIAAAQEEFSVALH